MRITSPKSAFCNVPRPAVLWCMPLIQHTDRLLNVSRRVAVFLVSLCQWRFCRGYIGTEQTVLRMQWALQKHQEKQKRKITLQLTLIGWCTMLMGVLCIQRELTTTHPFKQSVSPKFHGNNRCGHETGETRTSTTSNVPLEQHTAPEQQ